MTPHFESAPEDAPENGDEAGEGADHLDPLEGLRLHPEFVRGADGTDVVLLRREEFVQMVAALMQYEERLAREPRD